jgi:ribosomal protein S18 acetylase RimI-like enzyme
LTIRIEEMTMAHYEPVLALWRRADGVGLSSADEPDAIARYLARNPGLSFVAFAAEEVVGAVLCGHDGRRGFIHHLAVAPAFRRQGLGRRLVQRCLHGLAEIGIQKCHLFVFHENESAIAFWQAQGWSLRHDIAIMSRWLEEE